MSEEAEAVIQAKLFWRMHEGLPQQAPGSDATTRRALTLAQPLPDSPRILDLGCGPGRQTIVLAEALGGQIVALDLLQPFLDQLERRAREAGFADRIEVRCADIGNLSPALYPDESFDLIWSEGAIYNIGFDAGLDHWRRVLRPEGRIGLTEVAWLEEGEAAPPSVRDFWAGHYPGMRTQAENRQAVEAAGYRSLGEFVVPANEWWDDYYALIEARLDAVRAEETSDGWRRAIAIYDEEVEVVRSGLDAFGYVFSIMTPA